MEVRAALPDDFDAVGDLLVRAYEAAWGPTGWDEYRRELLDLAARSDLCETLVVISGGAVAGTVALVPTESPMRVVSDPTALEIRMLGVDPDMQRQGAATMLIAACAALARAQGLRSLVLQSDEDLTAARAVYEHLAFRRRPELDVSVDAKYDALGYDLPLGGANTQRPCHNAPARHPPASRTARRER